MNIIQSFWSTPAFHSFQSYQNSRKFGGWPNYKYFLISSALSCLTLRKENRSISLYTDTKGHDILINDLHLPYDDVSLVLDGLNNEDHRLWIRGKMEAIKLQSKPFLHVDNDIYVWEAFKNHGGSKHIIAQSYFPLWSQYRFSLQEIQTTFRYLPDCLKQRADQDTVVANVGVIGGNDIDFFQEMCETSKMLLQQNRDLLSQINIGGFNQMMEEYLFTSLARYKKYQIQYILEQTPNGDTPSYLKLYLVPLASKYIHLIGHYKANLFACEQLELRLKREFPQYYKYIREIIEDKYTELSMSEMEDDRSVSIEKALEILYTKGTHEIEQLKVRVRSGLDVIIATDYFTENGIQIIAKHKESDRKHRCFSPPFINQTDALVCSITEPRSILELAEEISIGNSHELNKTKAALLDSVAKNLLLGLIEVG